MKQEEVAYDVPNFRSLQFAVRVIE